MEIEDENTKHRYFVILKVIIQYMFFLAVIKEGNLSVVLLSYMRNRVGSVFTLLYVS